MTQLEKTSSVLGELHQNVVDATNEIESAPSSPAEEDQ